MKKLESVKSTKFEKLESKKIENLYAIKGGWIATGPGYSARHGMEYSSDCTNGDGTQGSYVWCESIED